MEVWTENLIYNFSPSKTHFEKGDSRMFQSFNVWYITLPGFAALMFLYGYVQYYAEACCVRQRRPCTERAPVTVWVGASAVNIVLPICESHDGFMQLIWNIQNNGRQPDDFVDVLAFIVLGLLYAMVLFYVYFKLMKLGENVGRRHAQRLARKCRAACRKASRPTACENCKMSQNFRCPVGIDRTPSWELSLSDLAEKARSINAQKNGVIDPAAEPVDYCIETLPSGTKAVLFDMELTRVYTEEPPRRAFPTEFRIGGCTKSMIVVALPRPIGDFVASRHPEV